MEILRVGTTLKSDAITTGSGHSLNNLNVTVNMVRQLWDIFVVS